MTREGSARLRKKMSRLVGEPVDSAGRVNAAGLSTFNGVGVIIWLGSLIWWISSSSVNVLVLGTSLWWAVEYLAWVGLRRRGGPLRFEARGGIIGVTSTTLYVARVSWWTGRTTKLGSWPREEVSFTRVSALNANAARFDLRFTADDTISHLDLVQNRGKEATLRALFGSDSAELTATPTATRPWGPGWTTPTDERSVAVPLPLGPDNCPATTMTP
jgi:hypothetical protein